MSEPIAIIGGGLGGCLTALLLAKQKNNDGHAKYDLTIVEMEDSLLNGASLVGFRLHLGGEYALDPQTMRNCVDAAVLHRLLMPETIFARTPRMQFLIAQGTEDYGNRHPRDKRALTLDKFEHNYETYVRQEYEAIFHRVAKHQGKQAGNLLGSYQRGVFFYRLAEAQYEHHRCHTTGCPRECDIAGGFQTSEPGIDLPKFHGMIRRALATQSNVQLLLKHRALHIEGSCPNFTVHLDGTVNSLPASQVVQAAWQRGPQLTPPHEDITVFRRAIMRVHLPDGPLPPVFVLSGAYGGMFAPESGKTALAYLPVHLAGHIKDRKLTAADGTLPADWSVFPEGLDEAQYRENYFVQLKQRFPKALARATDPILIVRETLSFDETIEQRQNKYVFEHDKGRFVLYPTKATYAAHVALQAAHMVQMRSAAPGAPQVHAPEDTIALILSPQDRERYSLAEMLSLEPEDPQMTLNYHDEMHLLPISGKMLRNPLAFREELDAVDIPINYVSADWHYRFVNRAYAAWYGRTPDQIIGGRVVDLIGEECFSVIRAYSERALQGQPICYTIGVKLSIGLRRIKCSYTPVCEADGSVNGWCGVIQDVTSRSE